MSVSRFVSNKGFYPVVPRGFDLALTIVKSKINLLMGLAVTNLKNVTPVRTGFMRSRAKAWGLRVYSRGGYRFSFGWKSSDFKDKKAFYPKYVEEGSGIWGPYKTPIVPRKAKVLRFFIGEREVVTFSVRGQPPQNLLEKASKLTVVDGSLLIRSAIREGFEKSFRQYG